MGFKGSVTYCKIVYKIFIVSRFLSLGYWKKFYTVGRTLDLVQDKFGFEFSLGHLHSLWVTMASYLNSLNFLFLMYDVYTLLEYRRHSVNGSAVISIDTYMQNSYMYYLNFFFFIFKILHSVQKTWTCRKMQEKAWITIHPIL